MKTYVPTQKEVSAKKWFLLDAKDIILGKLAVKAANIIRGKNKVHFVSHMDCGDFLIIINAATVKTTGKKDEQKMYYRHSGYKGGLKERSLGQLRTENPIRIIEDAVAGMIPHNKLKKDMVNRLKVYAGAEHPHQAQNPTTITI